LSMLETRLSRHLRAAPKSAAPSRPVSATTEARRAAP
ncbi:ABC transporter permease, partial [Paraburkholderia sp. SIMBA_049]